MKVNRLPLTLIALFLVLCQGITPVAAIYVDAPLMHSTMVSPGFNNRLVEHADPGLIKPSMPGEIFLNPELLVSASVDLEKCFVGYISAGMKPCDAPAGTDPMHIDDVWPQTVQFFEFSLATDSLLILEAHREITDQYPGSLGIDLHYYDTEQDKWVGQRFSWNTGTRNENGEISGNFDPDWVNQVKYDPNHVVHPAGQYRIMAWAALRMDGFGAVYGYLPSKGSFKVYAFENTPPEATPTPEIAAPDTPVEDTLPTQESVFIITLRASADGYEEAFDYIDNSPNFGIVQITGLVTDAATGAPISGATVQITGGANPTTALTAPDGTYTLTAVVPEGQGSGSVSDLNYALPLSADLTIHVFPTETELLADGLSSTEVRIEVRDLQGEPLPNRDLLLELQGNIGLGTLSATQATTDADGIIQVTYTSFKPTPGGSSGNTRHEIEVVARDNATGVSGSETIFVNQYLLSIVQTNPLIPACHQCDFPSKLTVQVTDYWLNPISNTPLTLRIEGANPGGVLSSDPKGSTGQHEITLTTDQNGSVTAYYHWAGDLSIAEVTEQVLILDGTTHAQVTQSVDVHGLDIGIHRIEEAGFTGVTGHQAFFKIYFKEYMHPDLPLDRFNAETLQKLGLRVSINQYHSDGVNTSQTFESTGSWAQDEGGWFVKMYHTPSMPYVVPVNDGGSWYEVRVDPVIDETVYLPDTYRPNNSTIFAVTTNSPDGWLHIWLKDGILTPHNWYGVVFKCVGRFLPVLGDAMTVIDTLNQTYNQDVLGLGQSVETVLTENLQNYSDSKILTKFKAGTINNVISCMQDAYGVYKQAGNHNSECAVLARITSSPHNQSSAKILSPQQIASLQDRFVQGVLMGSPDLRGLIAYNLSAEEVTLHDSAGSVVNDPDLMSSDGVVTVFLLPEGETFELDISTDHTFDLAVYDGGNSDGQRVTTRHSLQTTTNITGRMTLGPTSDLALALDKDGDGIMESSIAPQVTSQDVIKPEVLSLIPEDDTSVAADDTFLMAIFEDNPGGVGIDIDGVKIVIDDQDLTPAATITATDLSLPISAIGLGEHTARLIVSDLHGNPAVSEWSFTVQKGFNLFNTLPLIGIALLGGLLVLVVAVITILLIVRRKKKRQSISSLKIKTSPIQATDGSWWYQDLSSSGWLEWNGESWQPSNQTEPAISADKAQRLPPNKPPKPQRSGLKAWLLSLVVAGVMFLLIAGGVSLVAFQFFPGYQIPPQLGVTIQDVLFRFGGGVLISLIGLFAFRGGIVVVLTKRNIVEDEWGNQREQRGCAAIISGVLTALFGFLLLSGGLLLAAVSVYQQVLPLLGF